MLRPAFVAAAMAGALVAPALAAPRATAVDLLKVLAKPIAAAKRGRLRVLVPATLDTYSSPHLYGSGGATARGYDIQLANAPACHDANVCYLAEFSAAAGKPMAGARLALAHHLFGRYVASRCGASCNPAMLQWSEFGVNYTIGYIGNRRQIVTLADAAIDGGPR